MHILKSSRRVIAATPYILPFAMCQQCGCSEKQKQTRKMLLRYAVISSLTSACLQRTGLPKEQEHVMLPQQRMPKIKTST